MENKETLNFIEEIMENDLENGLFDKKIHTRFPPEPNGYLHIGHAKAICVNFELAQKYNGKTNLRFDDTNPVTEETEYVESIKQDVRWLGFEWNSVHYASDYFDQLYDWAVLLIKKGLAYVDDGSAEEIAKLKGTPTLAGTESPYRNRSVEENLDLFERMKNGEFADGSRVLRAKIDMANPNMHLRDPFLYRIKHATHHRTGDKWCIYPMYDFAHGQSDAVEGITHSLCTLEFVVHRPLYDWCLEALEIHHPKQIEFARLNLTYTIMSKRKLLLLVKEGHVSGWDDPRMPTLSGLRRKGYTPASIRNFVKKVGVAKRENISDLALLEFCVREDLNKIAVRAMAVLDPVKVVITNFSEEKVEYAHLENNPEKPETGSRDVPFRREIYIEREDFMEVAPKGYFRLTLGGMVRLKGAYIIKCEEVIKDEAGNITELRCVYIENSRSGQDTSGLKVKSVIHWVSVADALDAEVRIYDRLFQVENPAEAENFLTCLNPNSLTVVAAKVEPSLQNATLSEKYQFLRKGFFSLDPDSTNEKLVFNLTVTLKDAWAKEKGK